MSKNTTENLTDSTHHPHHAQDRITIGTLLITLGIIYGDIGTSPLYVMKAIIGEESPINNLIVLGGISCVIWTLTLQTTIKYVILTLKADNNGEGGIFSLFTLVRKKGKWLVYPAMIGGAALLADGIITPPISVASAVEGLRVLNKDIPTIPIVIVIISIIFLFQRFGTAVVGKAFGPIMLVWFLMLATLGLGQIVLKPEILQAVNPYYAFRLLTDKPEGFWLLGAVFLCTTGAEALYSDLGHCGRGNIRLSWIFVKITLILNYMGQGAWLMLHEGTKLGKNNPFYEIMPQWFLVIGIGIATLAAIIASQALITGSFTLVSEAIRLNFWPKVSLNYPSDQKGQLYVPSVNFLLWAGCIGIVLYFQESSAMESAYGLAITLAMLMTTILLGYYLHLKNTPVWVIIPFISLYFVIEISFLIANLTKFAHGGFVTLIIGAVLMLVMIIWYQASKIRAKLTDYVSLSEYIEPLKLLSNDSSIPRYATNLVYLTSTANMDEIETKTIYSIFQKQPKRADVYWFVHVKSTDEPYTMEYKVDILAKEDVIKVCFNLGFRVEQRIDLFFRTVVNELVKQGEVDITNRYNSLKSLSIAGDFRFVVLKRFLSNENELSWTDRLVMDGYFILKNLSTSEEDWFGLDPSSVVVEKVPMLIRPSNEVKLKRV
jgi:KUP system potassium uptake protein